MTNLKVGQSFVKCRKEKGGEETAGSRVGGLWEMSPAQVSPFWGFFVFFLLRCLLILHIYGLSKTQEGQLDGWEDREMKLQTRGG